MEANQMAELFIKADEKEQAPSEEERKRIFRYATELNLLRRDIEFVHAKIVKVSNKKRFVFEVFFDKIYTTEAHGEQCILSVSIDVAENETYGSFTLWDPLAEHKDKDVIDRVIASSEGKIFYDELVALIKHVQDIAFLHKDIRAVWYTKKVFKDIEGIKHDENVVSKIKKDKP